MTLKFSLHKTIIFCLIAITANCVYAQKPYSDTIFNRSVASINFGRNGFVLSEPIIGFNSGESLRLNFDYLSTESRYLNYTIVHCNADWSVSDLLKNEYLKSFTYDQINDVQYSNNSLQSYAHYELVFPNDVITPTKSGNYALIVYGDSEEDILFIRKFYIAEDLVSVNAKVKQATDIYDKFQKQEIDISINKRGFSISNTSKLKLYIKQNGRTDNIISLPPSAVTADEIQYFYDKENVFNGGSEFRTFDIKSVKYVLDRVERIEDIENNYHVFLYPDKRRQFLAYETLPDINGQRYLKTEDYDNQLAAEYVWVHFFIPTNMPIYGGDLYVFGQLTDWKAIPEALMTYNPKLFGYQGALYLKQGYYNYQYVFMPKDKTTLDETVTEGNHWETENQYTIFVYYRPDGATYDRLIATKSIKSK